jgi:large subunit ribosomal protein L21
MLEEIAKMVRDALRYPESGAARAAFDGAELHARHTGYTFASHSQKPANEGLAKAPAKRRCVLTLVRFSFKNFVSGKTSMKYAVVRTGGKQYRVSEGDVVRIEKLVGEVGDKITLSDVLFVGDNGEVKIGAPLVANATVTGEIVGQGKAKKVLVFKKKRRKSYSRQRGHRQHQTTLKIIGIDA